MPHQLVVPFDAMINFTDPSVGFALQFGDAANSDDVTAIARPAQVETTETAGDDASESTPGEDKVVTLDAFRKK